MSDNLGVSHIEKAAAILRKIRFCCFKWNHLFTFSLKHNKDDKINVVL